MSFDKIKILITGGLGAIGQNLLFLLEKNPNLDIHVVDNYSSGNNCFKAYKKFTYLDISNSEKIKSFFSDYSPHYIFHLAAHFANQNSVEFPISDASTNIIGLINILESQKSNSNLIKFVYSSSSCVYGNNPIMSEETTVKPYDTPYAINKYVGELYCKYYSEVHSVPTICLRIFNTYGPGELNGKYRNVIPNFIYKALKNEDIFITGSGDETRDFTYVTDTVNLLISAAYSQYNNGDVFNGGTGKKISIKKLAEIIIKSTNSKSRIKFVAPRSWDHIADRCSDISKSHELLCYEPEIDIYSGIHSTVDWFKNMI